MAYAPAESLGGVGRDGPSMQVFIQLSLSPDLDFESEMCPGSSSLRSHCFSVMCSPGLCLVVAAKERCGNTVEGHKC